MENTTKKIIFGITGIVLVAIIGSIFVNLGMDWFDKLVTPNHWINKIIIPFVWTIIYILFGIYIFIATKSNTINKKTWVLLILNGLANIIWCLAFFTFNSLLVGLIVIIINLYLAIFLLKEILKHNHCFNYFLILYPLWLSFATCLNIALWILN